MREFFHGWRRKMGCVTLLMALMLAAIGVRSSSQHDGLSFVIFGRHHLLQAWNGNCEWYGDTAAPDVPSWEFRSYPRDRYAPALEPFDSVLQLHAIIDFGNQIPWKWKIDRCSLLPLALLSAYLILWKPRKSSETGSSQG